MPIEPISRRSPALRELSSNYGILRDLAPGGDVFLTRRLLLGFGVSPDTPQARKLESALRQVWEVASLARACDVPPETVLIKAARQFSKPTVLALQAAADALFNLADGDFRGRLDWQAFATLARTCRVPDLTAIALFACLDPHQSGTITRAHVRQAAIDLATKLAAGS